MWGIVAGAIACLAGCGRLGFDARGAGAADASTSDADPGQYVISATSLTANATHSWVDLEVDWPRSLAYLATREPGQCFAVIDLATSPPSIIARRGPPATAGDRCLGVRIENNGQRLLVTSEAGDAVELWDLGADPRAASFTRLASITVGVPRRIAADPGATAIRYVARGSAVPGVQAVQLSATVPYLTLGSSYAAGPCTYGHNDVSVIATDYAITGCSDDASAVELVDSPTMQLVDSIPADNGGLSGFWSAARTADGAVAVMGGWVSATIATSGTAPGWRLVARWDNEGAYRGAVIVEGAPTGPQLWAAKDTGAIEVLELETATPRVIHHAPLGVEGEAYALEVDAASERAIVVTNRGYLVVVDTARLPATDFTWPAL